MKEKINLMKENVKKGLYVHNLERLIEECDSLIEAAENPLPYFVLREIFRRLWSKREEREIRTEDFEREDAIVKPGVLETLDLLEKGKSDESLESLNSLLRNIHNII